MSLILSAVAAIICALCYYCKSKWNSRMVRHFITEAKYEMVYNIVGTKAVVEDLWMRKQNATDLWKQTGKIVVITGGTRGIGVAVIKMLMQCDIRVIMGCRNVEVGVKLLKKIRSEFGVSTGDLQAIELDISSAQSVRKFAMELKQLGVLPNVLINNAGIMYVPYAESLDGFESQFATNYLGHYLLTHYLLQGLRDAAALSQTPSRVVNVASCAYLTGAINLQDINNKENFIKFEGYAQSKLAQILFTFYADKLMSTCTDFDQVRMYAIHPGVVNTELFNGTILQKLAPWIPRLFFKTAEAGAMTIVHAAISKKLDNQSGVYLSNCTVQNVARNATDVPMQKALFNWTKKQFGVNVFGQPNAETFVEE